MSHVRRYTAPPDKARRDRPDLDKSEPGAQHRPDNFGILVEPGGQADRVGEIQPADLHRQARIVRGSVDRAESEAQRFQGEIVGSLGVEASQQGQGDVA